jgi:acyl carrier protein
VTNLDNYKNAFIESLEVEENQLEGLKYQDVPGWDSIGHMTLMAALEEVFDIMMDTEDIIDFSSFEKGKEILGKYDVEL